MPLNEARDSSLAHRLEPRWPVVAAVLAMLLVLTVTPGRARIVPFWFPYALTAALFIPMIGVWLSGGRTRWLLFERTATLLYFMVVEVITLMALLYLMLKVLGKPAEFSGTRLLASSIAAWVNNILAFSLAYWEMDRDGPEARLDHSETRPDWLFPQTAAPEQTPQDWMPTYVDYLYLAYSTATAFSSTDVLPLTSRAKMLMMVQSTVSLGTLVIVAARAINILG